MSVTKQDASQIKFKQRVANRGEVFTAKREVNGMFALELIIAVFILC